MSLSHRSSHLLPPARTWFIVVSLLMALLLNYIPTGRVSGVPDWVALVLTFWCVREPQRVGMSVAMGLGLLVDIGQGAAIGQHALAYVTLAFLAALVARRILWFPSWKQALQLWPLFLLAQVIMVAVRLLGGGEFPGWAYFASSLTTAALWPTCTVLLLWPQVKAAADEEQY